MDDKAMELGMGAAVEIEFAGAEIDAVTDEGDPLTVIAELAEAEFVVELKCACEADWPEGYA
jgi:hypothetical protein